MLNSVSFLVVFAAHSSAMESRAERRVVIFTAYALFMHFVGWPLLFSCDSHLHRVLFPSRLFVLSADFLFFIDPADV